MSGTQIYSVGQILKGAFRIDSELGSGTFGAVFKGTQLGLGRQVAIKVLRAEAFQYPSALDRFQREALIASRISHPVMAQIVDYGVVEGAPFLVMEYVDGVELTEVLEKHGALPLGRAIEVLRQLTSLLIEIHSRGIVHRDLKPQNMKLLRYSPESRQIHLKVLDFGIAKDLTDTAEQSLTATGSFVGTPRYMAPEQLRGEAVDGRADLYAAGVIFYELVTGDLPYDARSLAELVAKVLSDPIRPLPPALPPVVRQTIERLLSRNSNERFRTAEELDLALERCAAACQTTPSGMSISIAKGGEGADRTMMAGSSDQTNPLPAAAALSPPANGGLSRRTKGIMVGIAAAAVAVFAFALTQRKGPSRRESPANSTAGLAQPPVHDGGESAGKEIALTNAVGGSAIIPIALSPDAGAAAQTADPGATTQPTIKQPPTIHSVADSVPPDPPTTDEPPAANDQEARRRCVERLDVAEKALSEVRPKRAIAAAQRALTLGASSAGCHDPAIRVMARAALCKGRCQGGDTAGAQSCIKSLARESVPRGTFLTQEGFSVRLSDVVKEVRTFCANN